MGFNRFDNMADIEVTRTRTREVQSCPPCPPPPSCGCSDQPTPLQVFFGLVIFAVAIVTLAAMTYGSFAMLGK